MYLLLALCCISIFIQGIFPVREENRKEEERGLVG